METENKVWVVTGEDWDHEKGTRVVIGVCPSEKDAENLKLRVKNEYDNIWVQEFRSETWKEPSVIYDGHFKVEIRPLVNKHYILHKIMIMNQERKVLPVECEPKEKFEFSVGHVIKTDAPEIYLIAGEFTSVEKAPFESDEHPNKSDALKQWLIRKINEKGLITLELPI